MVLPEMTLFEEEESIMPTSLFAMVLPEMTLFFEVKGRQMPQKLFDVMLLPEMTLLLE